jgi:hypothetical protein
MESKSQRNLYSVWYQIKQRCYNRRRKDYKYYGEKGVKMCDEWKHSFIAFQLWYRSNESGVEDVSLSVDRIDSQGDYCPNNCQLIPCSENSKRVVHSRDELGRFACCAV